MWGDILSSGINAIAGLWQGHENREAAQRNTEMNIAMQREFAQNGVRWKVADAKAAGVHPLFALGANTQSFTNVAGEKTDDDSIAQAGQNIGRAAQAAMTSTERDKSNAADALTLEKAGLENELLRTQISSLKQKQLGPAMPSGNKKADAAGIAGPLTLVGQGDAKRAVNLPHGFNVQPRKNETSANDLEDEYGEIADVVGAYRMLKDAGIAVGEKYIRPYVVNRREDFYKTGYGRPRKRGW